jgi:hypothetical protein
MKFRNCWALLTLFVMLTEVGAAPAFTAYGKWGMVVILSEAKNLSWFKT